MFLFKEGLSLIIRRLSFNSNRNFLFSLVFKGCVWDSLLIHTLLIHPFVTREKHTDNNLFCVTANIQLLKSTFKEGVELAQYQSHKMSPLIYSKFCKAFALAHYSVFSNTAK